jgi:tRNA (guanine37-N1)-methyltransferase
MSDSPGMFSLPVVRSAGAVLDKTQLARRIPLAAARVLNNKNISKLRTQLDASRDLLRVERVASVREDPEAGVAARGGKCLLLRQEIEVKGRIFVPA